MAFKTEALDIRHRHPVLQEEGPSASGCIFHFRETHHYRLMPAAMDMGLLSPGPVQKDKSEIILFRLARKSKAEGYHRPR